MLARESPVDADVVVPVPDSGVAAAIGFASESGIPFRQALIRNHYVGRTFIEPSQAIRDFGVKLKLNPVRHLLEGKRVILVDDSIVRGTTSRKIVRMVRNAGAREVHLRISCPPTISPCFYGVDTPCESELIAANNSIEEIRQFVEADSLAYLSLGFSAEGCLRHQRRILLRLLHRQLPHRAGADRRISRRANSPLGSAQIALAQEYNQDMGATTTLVTVPEFLELPESEGQLIELIGGEVISMPKSGQPHEVTKSNVIRVVTAWLFQNPALKLFCEAAYQLDERNCLIPDISLIAPSRIVPGGTGVFQRAAELAIEVVSSEPAARLEKKIRLYLAHGGKSFGQFIPKSAWFASKTLSGPDGSVTTSRSLIPFFPASAFQHL